MDLNSNNQLPNCLAGLHWPDAHPEEVALLEGCVESPDDLGRQLIWADWLQKNDQEKVADFIRIQCEFWPRETIDAVRRQQATEAAIDYWKPRFNHGDVACEIVSNESEFNPLMSDVRSKRYGRTFVLGLPTRVIAGVRTLHKLSREGVEQSLLTLTTDLQVPCEPREEWYGVYGNYGFYNAAQELSAELNEVIHESPFATSLTNLNLYRVPNPKLPFGRLRTEVVPFLMYPTRAQPINAESY